MGAQPYGEVYLKNYAAAILLRASKSHRTNQRACGWSRVEIWKAHNSG